MSSQLPVIAAIPNYNMAESLERLLAQLITQNYHGIYVLDDCSTDDSRKVVARFAPRVTWVASTQNGGAGAARNKILEAYKQNCIIHFLDADVHLETTDNPAKARLLMADPRIAFTGGLVLDERGKQHLWNFGPDNISLHSQLTAFVHLLFGSVQATRPLWRSCIRWLTAPARAAWPDIAVAPKRRAVYWPVEANLLIRRSTLELLGGFDPSVHEFDIIPPARKAQQLGLVNVFDPTIVVTHLSVNVRKYNRTLALYRELYRLIKRYGGWRAYIFPGGRFKPRYNKLHD